MSVAIRAITRLQDADDAPSLGAGQDGYTLTWDNASGAFVATALSAGATDHGALTGLTPDDDHTQYALLAGRAGGQTIYGDTAADGDITIHGTSNATRTTSYVNLQPTAGAVCVGSASTGFGKLDVGGFGTPVAIGTSPAFVVGIAANVNGSSGVQMYNSSTGVSADFRFVVLNNTKLHSVSVVAGSSSNSNISFGIARKDGVFMWSYGGGGTAPTLGIGTIDAGALVLGTTNTERMRISSAGEISIGTATASGMCHVVSTTETTDAVRTLLTLGANVTGAGVGAAGLGPSIALQAESSTTDATAQARIAAVWYEATHATRKADLVLTAYDTAEREGLRIRGAGSAPAIGFLGATPAARQAHVADPTGGGTVDAEARSAINSILATLETFGFHATS